jgi:hypothetical protein
MSAFWNHASLKRSAAARRIMKGPAWAVLLGAGVAACRADDPGQVTETIEAILESPLGDARRGADCGPPVADRLPDDLQCTGLYSDWTTRTIDPSIASYAPGFALWSDGAEKTRFIQLPPGAQIDARDMNAWVFPVGTKLWKEFRVKTSHQGRDPGRLPLVETRMIQKTAEGRWLFATYVWSVEQDSARRVTAGIMPYPGTDSYEVPSERMCNRCHNGRPDRVLGFEAVLLAAPEATGLTYERLLAAGRLRGAVGHDLPSPAALQIPGDPVARDAIGRLHANCGLACHNPTGPAPFSMRIDVVDGSTPRGVEGTSVFQEAIGQESFFTPAKGAGRYYRIRPTDPDGSTIFYRMGRRDLAGGGEQMPPIATHQTDTGSLSSVRGWIASMTAPPYPAPGPR